MALRVRKHAAATSGRGGASPVVVVGLGVLVIGSAVLGAYAYDRSTADRILPGITVGGVDVGEKSRCRIGAAAGAHQVGT